MSQLNQLVSRSNEAKIVLERFSERTRIHKGKPILVQRMYFELAKDGIKVDKEKFEKVFFDLEKLGEGRCIKTKYGNLREFHPKRNIIALGKEAMEQVKHLPETHTRLLKVTVEFKIGEHTCRADIPAAALQDFERMIGNG